MARITATQLDGVRAQIDKLDRSVAAKVVEVIESVGIDDIEALREALLRELAPVVSQASTLASQLARACYNSWRIRDIGESFADAGIYPSYDAGKFEAAVNTAVKKVADGGTAEDAANVVVGRSGYEVRSSYSSTIFENAKRDSRKPRYARVPGSSEACDFCLMLASRGFTYSKGKAGENVHNHANCKCVYVVSWAGSPEVEGFDQQTATDRWQAAVDAKAQERAARNGTTEAQERAAIMKSYRDAAKRAKKRSKER